MSGTALLSVYGATMIAVGVWCGRAHWRDRTEFLLANRSIGVLPGALSVAASWIWAPALLIASQKAYEQGLAGVFWFTVPNFLALALFAPLAARIRELHPAGYTLPQFMRLYHGRGVHFLYLIQFFGLQICSFAVQILAGAALLEMTTGLSFLNVALALVAISLTYSLLGGLRASISTDVLQMLLIFGVISIAVPWSVSEAGGVSRLLAGVGGMTGAFRDLFDPWVAYSFGIPVTIGLLAGPIGDQMHWQRAHSIKSPQDVMKTFLIGAVLFVIVPLSLSVLGFVAADGRVSGGWTIESPQLIGPVVVLNLLPKFMAILFSVMLLSGLCSTLDSVLCAVSSMVSVDLAGKTDAEKYNQQPTVARIGMVVAATVGLAIACIPRIQILHLFLFYGTWRASTMIPTVLTLFWPRVNSRSVFAAILLSLIFGAPIYAAGAYLKRPHISVTGSLLVVAIGFVTCVVWSLLKPHTRERTLPEEREMS